VAVSNDVAVSIQENIHPHIPVHTILNGVNTHHFRRNPDAGLLCRQQNGIPANAILVGNIAVFRSQKRLKAWIDLFYEVYQQHPDLYGCLVGDGLLKEEIVAHIAARGLTGRILLPGIQKNVIPWLSAMDIFLMTSEFEGLPVALLEAMSMECAVLCTDAGGIKEVIRNGVDGFIVPVADWRSMDVFLNQWLTEKEKIRSWGAAARKRVVETFSIDLMIAQTEKLYRSFEKRK
jgi:glycosyltransferase involved in cell wall biosynthesis